MSYTVKTKIKLNLSDGKSTVINLPAPVNMTLTDEDSGNVLYPAAFDSIKAVFATDNGDTVTGADFIIVKTSETTIAESYHGDI